ncbi:hypothetical protein GCM10010371_50360 [Streptomyces subrutilus]|uniref:Uncharacterized protein n=1 Tax=Streptomyces subrutilus TaxID=36818 RepID=A0A918R275_9ACTN|nr:hypothetical protein [Streptomyces subrutilus]GGZ84508.1 hypothetical protein GCM10010371_50360 [Streptomyces subrutilus]
MIRTRIAQAVAVVSLSLTGVILVSAAASAAAAEDPSAAVTARVSDSLGWG